MVSFYGLLLIDRDEGRPVNLTRSGGDPVDIYIRCAATCSASFAYHGLSWTLITNDEAFVKERLRQLGLSGVAVRAHRFSWRIPEGISFRSAHYKLELFEAFGTGAFGDHVGLVDLDMVMLAPLAPAVLAVRGLVGYHIGRMEVADYGEQAIAGAVSAVAGSLQPATWWGGEFLLGHAADFRLFSQYVARVWPAYVSQVAGLHHQGDEAVATPAIALMRRDGHQVTDAGANGGVARWWSARTRSPHPRLRTALACSLLHLPADKPFLATRAGALFDPASFVVAFRRIARRKVWIRRFGGIADRLRRRPVKAAPRL